MWEFNVETSIGSGSPDFTFKQDGEKITGTYSGAFGTEPLTGIVDGKEIRFTFHADADGQKALVEYNGTVEGETMKGTVKMGALGEGTFTGKRTKKS